MGKRILVALGGNAILRHKEKGTKEEQFENVRETCRHLVALMKRGYRIAITHGNGPQVGDILLKNELSKHVLPPMPLDVCGAESQGMIGYMLQQSMYNEMRAAGIYRPIATFLTQVVVDRGDPAFRSPSKPIGPYYTAMEASKLREEKGWVVENDSGRGYRRVVPSPQPIEIVEKDAIVGLCDQESVIIAGGGGGIPVIRNDAGDLEGVEAVIDKDLSAALLARLISADVLLILTDVEKVSLNFGRPNQQELATLSAGQAEAFLNDGHFPPGSMGPKIESAIAFVRTGGERAIITTPEHALSALEGTSGTTILPDIES
jgi:carbamate kinase